MKVRHLSAMSKKREGEWSDGVMDVSRTQHFITPVIHYPFSGRF
jgi:hypothetical protein